MNKNFKNNIMGNWKIDEGCVFISDINNRRLGYLVKIACNRESFLHDNENNSIWAIRSVSSEISSFLRHFISCEIPYSDTLITEIPNRKNTDLQCVYGMNVECKNGTLYDHENKLVELFKTKYNEYSKEYFSYGLTEPLFLSIEKFSFDNNGNVTRNIL